MSPLREVCNSLFVETLVLNLRADSGRRIRDLTPTLSHPMGEGEIHVNRFGSEAILSWANYPIGESDESSFHSSIGPSRRPESLELSTEHMRCQ